MQARRQFWPSAAQRVGLTVFALVVCASQAQAGSAFSFIAADGASGTLSYGLVEATDNGNGTFTATSGFLVVLSGPLAGTYELFPNPNPPNTFSSPSGVFICNDLLYPGHDPTLDVFGLLFTGGGLEINIWNDGGGVKYSYYAFNGSGFVLASAEAADFLLAVTPAQQIEILQDVVPALVATGAHLPANGNSLLAKLNAALNAVNRGNANAATGSLNAFINQVNAFVSNGTLTPADGDSLIEMASAIITALGG
jgi:hypothetical protein